MEDLSKKKTEKLTDEQIQENTKLALKFYDERKEFFDFIEKIQAGQTILFSMNNVEYYVVYIQFPFLWAVEKNWSTKYQNSDWFPVEKFDITASPLICDGILRGEIISLESGIMMSLTIAKIAIKRRLKRGE